jgi:hypothetical protein
MPEGGLSMIRMTLLKLAAAAALALGGAAASAQAPGGQETGGQETGGDVSTVDPNVAAEAEAAEAQESEWVATDAGDQRVGDGTEAADQSAETASAASASVRASQAATGARVPRKDVFSAAEGVFGKGAEGLGDLIEDLLRKQGEPNAYITGREAGGAFVVGARYGSGTLHHQIEGDRPVYWTGPSVGFDFGADANKIFVLVYNLHDAERLFRRYPAAEGNAYVIGGFTASYLRRGDVVLIPIRLGVGARLGVNAGYMRFSQKNRWLPF